MFGWKDKKRQITQNKVLKYQFLPEGRVPGPHTYLPLTTFVTLLSIALSYFIV